MNTNFAGKRSASPSHSPKLRRNYTSRPNQTPPRTHDHHMAKDKLAATRHPRNLKKEQVTPRHRRRARTLAGGWGQVHPAEPSPPVQPQPLRPCT
eukprot:scaffold60538_cov36-Tisochrysis_lutea.AAC.1